MTRLPESSKPERDVYEVEMRSLEGEILRGIGQSLQMVRVIRP